jgi:hypothetical protein
MDPDGQKHTDPADPSNPDPQHCSQLVAYNVLAIHNYTAHGQAWNATKAEVKEMLHSNYFSPPCRS